MEGKDCFLFKPHPPENSVLCELLGMSLYNNNDTLGAETFHLPAPAHGHQEGTNPGLGMDGAL